MATENHNGGGLTRGYNLAYGRSTTTKSNEPRRRQGGRVFYCWDCYEMALKMLAPLLAGREKPVAGIPAKQAEAFYLSREWREFRRAKLAEAGYRCAVAGCMRRARVVDHPLSRRWGGEDFPQNARCLCMVHDARMKEKPDGTRKLA